MLIHPMGSFLTPNRSGKKAVRNGWVAPNTLRPEGATGRDAEGR